ncbi:hypothetical protein EJB05_27611, partial [Eragrostis curvula]
MRSRSWRRRLQRGRPPPSRERETDADAGCRQYARALAPEHGVEVGRLPGALLRLSRVGPGRGDEAFVLAPSRLHVPVLGAALTAADPKLIDQEVAWSSKDVDDTPALWFITSLRYHREYKYVVLIMSSHAVSLLFAAELTIYSYQPRTGNAKTDKSREDLVDDYNAIVRRHQEMFRRMPAGLGPIETGSRSDIKDVLKMAAQAKAKHDELFER